MRARMGNEKAEKHTGKCFDCQGKLQLFEMDMKKSTKIMLCENCGLFHFYRKNFIGNYDLLKVSKNSKVEE